MQNNFFKIDINGKELEVNVNDLAERSNGSAFVRFGETEILAVATMGSKDVEGLDYFPLSVNYDEKFYAGGKILGSRFTRREGRPTNEAVLNARLVDRTIRPLFPEGIKREVLVNLTLLSWDGETDPSTLAIFGASLALSLSDIPWNGPVAGVRIGNKLEAFPKYDNKEDIDLIASGLKDIDGSILFNMFEAGLQEIEESTILEGISKTKPYIEKLINFQEEIKAKVGREKQIFVKKERNEEVEKAILENFKDRFEQEIESHDLFSDVKSFLKENFEEDEVKTGMNFLEKQIEKTLHEIILEKGKRPDGRTTKELRPLFATIDFLKRVHGSGVFERGQTKVLSVLTLGGPGEEKIIEGVEYAGKKRFMHHYNFPSFSVGEARPPRGPGRREIGHGRLGEKALEAVLPNVQDFPYTIRLVAEVLSSNGSSSMASTCASCLAMMAGGVPLKAPVGGIAMGIVVEMNDKPVKDRKYEILTDIQGSEDHYGDMDFKVAGTRKGVTALQMDVKLEGVNEEMLKKGLEQAKIARENILTVMESAIPEPRKELSPYAPRVEMIKINPEKIGDVIGPQGKIINEIIDSCNVTIEIEESGEVYITSVDSEGMEKARKWIESLTKELEIGKIYDGIVKKTIEIGAFVEIAPGKEGMVHISELDEKRVAKVSDVVKIGDKISVKLISIDGQGRINLSLKKAKTNANPTSTTINKP